jgi:hypothetical protein
VHLFVKKNRLKRKNIIKIMLCKMHIIGKPNMVAIPLQIACMPVANNNHAV